MHFLIELDLEVQLNIGQMVTLDIDAHLITKRFPGSHNYLTHGHRRFGQICHCIEILRRFPKKDHKILDK